MQLGIIDENRAYAGGAEDGDGGGDLRRGLVVAAVRDDSAAGGAAIGAAGHLRRGEDGRRAPVARVPRHDTAADETDHLHRDAALGDLRLQLVHGDLDLYEGDPAYRTDIIVTYLYKLAFVNLDFGAASALAVVTFVLLIVFSVTYSRVYLGRRAR